MPRTEKVRKIRIGINLTIELELDTDDNPSDEWSMKVWKKYADDDCLESDSEDESDAYDADRIWWERVGWAMYGRDGKYIPASERKG